MNDDIKRDMDFYTLYDNEGRPFETFTVEVPTDEELRDYWIVANEKGEIIGVQQTRIGRVKPEDVLCNDIGHEGVCCYQVSREDYMEAIGQVRDAGTRLEYVPPVDERFRQRFIRAQVQGGGKIRKRISEEEWVELQ